MIDSPPEELEAVQAAGSLGDGDDTEGCFIKISESGISVPDFVKRLDETRQRVQASQTCKHQYRVRQAVPLPLPPSKMSEQICSFPKHSMVMSQPSEASVGVSTTSM